MKDKVYLRVVQYLIRIVGGTMNSNINFLLSQLCEKKNGKYRIVSVELMNYLKESCSDTEISLFEKKLTLFI